MSITNKKIEVELFLLCYNEKKMIPHTLNYYSKFCSKITIYDNDSTDDSLELIKTFDDSIEIIRLNSNGEFREDLLTETRNNCWKGSTADYVIVCDMDEFLYDESMLEKLVEAKAKDVAIPVVIGYNMIASDFPDNYNIPITEQVKHGVRTHRFDKRIIFDPKKVKNINFGPGSHLFAPEFHTENAVDELIEFKLLHYKYMNKKYLYQKHHNNAERMSSINKENKWGDEYLRGKEFVDDVYKSSHYLIKVIHD